MMVAMFVSKYQRAALALLWCVCFPFHVAFSQWTSGREEYILDNGDRYTGKMVDGLPDGRGRIVYTDGEQYEGFFVRGKRHGRGRYLYGDESVYEGGWLDGQPHGKGILYRKYGTKYSQQYANGQLL